MSSGIFLAQTLDGSYRLECWAGTRKDMPAIVKICAIEGSVDWDELVAKVAEHQDEHLCWPEADQAEAHAAPAISETDT